MLSHFWFFKGMSHLAPLWKAIATFLQKRSGKRHQGMFEAKSMKHVSRYTLHLILPTGHSRACLGWIIYWDVFFYVYICKLNSCRECSYALELHCVFFFSLFFIFIVTLESINTLPNNSWAWFRSYHMLCILLIIILDLVSCFGGWKNLMVRTHTQGLI